jgi:hypothetical protein
VRRLQLPGGRAAAEPAVPAARAAGPVRAGPARAAVQRFLQAGADGDFATAVELTRPATIDPFASTWGAGRRAG